MREFFRGSSPDPNYRQPKAGNFARLLTRLWDHRKDQLSGMFTWIASIYIRNSEVMPMILYPAVRQYGSCTLSWWRSLREVLMKVHPRQRRERLNALLEAMHVFDKPHFIMEWASWPFGEHVRSRWSKGCDDPRGLEREEGLEQVRSGPVLWRRKSQ
eukprot:s2220_g10.t1